MIFEAGNETREKICSDFDAEQKWRAERKESGFCWYRCFWESEKFFLKFFFLGKFIEKLRNFKPFFLIFLQFFFFKI